MYSGSFVSGGLESFGAAEVTDAAQRPRRAGSHVHCGSKLRGQTSGALQVGKTDGSEPSVVNGEVKVAKFYLRWRPPVGAGLAFVMASASVVAPAQAEQFSIKCTWNPQYPITFDEDGKRVMALAKGAMLHKGVVDSITEDELRFHIFPEQPNGGGGVWSRKNGSLNSLSSLSEPIDRRYEDHCFRTKLRLVMSRYDEIWSW
jgi:hypothetical protein